MELFLSLYHVSFQDLSVLPFRFRTRKTDSLNTILPSLSLYPLSFWSRVTETSIVEPFYLCTSHTIPLRPLPTKGDLSLCLKPHLSRRRLSQVSCIPLKVSQIRLSHSENVSTRKESRGVQMLISSFWLTQPQLVMRVRFWSYFIVQRTSTFFVK